MDSDFYATWRQFQGKQEEDAWPLCPLAGRFSQKLEQVLFVPLARRPANRKQVAQAKYLLQEEWHAWKRAMPERHLAATTKRHRCLQEVYEASFDRLHLMELELRPVLDLIIDFDELIKPPPAPAVAIEAAPIEIAGIFLGEGGDFHD